MFCFQCLPEDGCGGRGGGHSPRGRTRTVEVEKEEEGKKERLEFGGSEKCGGVDLGLDKKRRE